jgi:hypothetical protein
MKGSSLLGRFPAKLLKPRGAIYQEKILLIGERLKVTTFVLD